jgi:hypothetical protein
MNVSPNELRKETVATLKEINLSLELARTTQSPAIVATLLLAKTTGLNTLTLLNQPQITHKR